jgi:hypothetical protein
MKIAWGFALALPVIYFNCCLFTLEFVLLLLGVRTQRTQGCCANYPPATGGLRTLGYPPPYAGAATHARQQPPAAYAAAAKRTQQATKFSENFFFNFRRQRALAEL